MPYFSYQAIDGMGAVVRGRQKANSPLELQEVLKNKNLQIQNFTQLEDKSVRVSYKYKTKPLAIFCRQLSSMLTAGVSLVKAMHILTTQEENKRCKALLRSIYEDLQRGMSFSESLQVHHSAFPNLFVSMVAAGESAGNLDMIVERISEHFANEAKTGNKVRGAMIYPIVLSILMFGVIMALFGFVMPMFRELAGDSEIPPLSAALFMLSDFIQGFWYVIVLVIVGIVLGLKAAMKTPGFRLFYGKTIISIPKVGKLIGIIYTARFARTMSNLFASGLQMIECIEKSVDTLGNAYVSFRFLEVVNDVKKGESLSAAISKINVFSGIFTATILIGEESGQLDNILAKSADFYEEEADTAIAALVGMMEPILIIVMGVSVGLVLGGVFPLLYAGLGGLGT